MRLETAQRREWMEARLKEIRRRPIDLARHLKIKPPRVYEVLSGKRKLQQKEMSATAQFLEWPLEVLTDLVSGKPPEEVVPLAGSGFSSTSLLAELPRNIPIRAAAPLDNEREFALGTSIVDHARRFPKLTGRTDVFGVIMHTGDMAPWRELGQLVLCEQNRPPREGDYVLIELRGKDDGDPPMSRAMIKYLVRLNAKSLRVRQFNPQREFDVLRSSIKKSYRIMVWDELIA